MLYMTDKGDPRVRQDMMNHYSSPKGFVGRSLVYQINYNGIYYGSIVAGSATKNLPGRNEYFNIDPKKQLNCIINNIFFHIERLCKKYPLRNFVVEILKEFREVSAKHWEEIYGDKVIGFETLVEGCDEGECYKRDGWMELEETKGFTCKRISGDSTDSWGGCRVWDYKNLRPKLVFVRRV